MTSGNSDMILRALSEFMGSNPICSAWFCGITHDKRAGLFGDHNVWELGRNWKCLEAVDEASARSVEKALRAKGCKGAPPRYDGGRQVFVYKIGPTTIE